MGVLEGSKEGSKGTTEDFFQQFVREMLEKPWYQRATAAQKAKLADRIELMKPHFLGELQKLAAQGGNNYVVTAADVTSVLATVTARLGQNALLTVGAARGRERGPVLLLSHGADL